MSNSKLQVLSSPFGSELHLKILDEGLIVNGKEVDYGAQMILSDKLFLVDYALDIPLYDEIEQIDQIYYFKTVSLELVKELERTPIQICYEIIKIIPIKLQILTFIFKKLSVPRFQILLSDDHFYVWLYLKTLQLANNQQINSSDIFEVEQSLKTLSEPFQKLLYLFDHISYTQLELRDCMSCLATALIQRIISKENFISSIAYDTFNDQNTSQKVSLNFLEKLHKIFIVVRYEKNMVGKESLLKKYIFNNECLEIINIHFQDLFQYQRKRFSIILALAIVYNPQQFWNIIFSTKNYCAEKCDFGQSNSNKNGQQEASRLEAHDKKVQMTKNLKIFIQLIINSLHSNDSNQLESIRIILQRLLSSDEAQFQTVILVLQSLIDFCSHNQILSIFVETISKMTPNIIHLDSTFIFISDYLAQIGHTISYYYNFGEASVQKKNNFQKRQKVRKINSSFFSNIFKVFISILDIDFCQKLIDNNLIICLSRLLKYTKGQRGMIQGARRSFILKLRSWISENEGQSQRLSKELEKMDRRKNMEQYTNLQQLISCKREIQEHFNLLLQ